MVNRLMGEGGWVWLVDGIINPSDERVDGR